MLIKKSKRKIFFLGGGGGGGASEIRQTWGGACPKRLKTPVIGYWAGDYFQALRNIIAPAAPMVGQQSSLIITPEWEYSS